MQRSDDGSRGSPAADRGGAEGRRSRPPDETTGTGDIAGSYRKAGPYLDASWQLTGSVALWVVVGYFLDKWLHTAPWLLVAGAVFGIGLGFYLFFKSLSAIEKGGKP
jgi:ATP synthase protein I